MRTTSRRLRATVTAVAVGCLVSLAAPAGAATTIQVGGVGGLPLLSGAAGKQLPRHGYGHLNRPEDIPTLGPYITMRSNVTWPQLAAAQPGSAPYQNMVRWGNALKARGGQVLFAFHHEPENVHNDEYGTPADYVRAWRKVRSVFVSQGATNVKFIWQTTAFGFRTSPTRRNHAPHFYPGDDVVDFVSMDGYNWGSCRGYGQDETFSQIMDKGYAFARSHGKRIIIGEFGAEPDAGRAAWLREASAWMIARKSTIHSVWYFQLSDHIVPACAWAIHPSTNDATVFRQQFIQDTVNFR